MSQSSRKVAIVAAAGSAALMAFTVSEASLRLASFQITSADARIGRPMTPMSYAGVARRTTRRAVVAGGAAAAAAGAYYYAAPPYGASGCVQVVDAYGRMTYRCR
jgi:hypothetical protein